MDLQSILAASDSEEDSDVRISDASIHMDLEQILRESDGEEEEDDDDDAELEAVLRSRAWETTRAKSHLVVDDSSGAYPAETSLTSVSHNAEDWAVLQAILNEDEERDGDDDDWMESTSSLLQNTSFQRDSSVDELLRSSAHDKPVEDTDSSLSSTTTPANLPTPPALSPPKKREVPVRPIMARHRSVDVDDHESSRAALANALAYERKLLKAGHREIVSPLMVKRRLKPKVELTSRSSSKTSTKKTTMAERLVSSNVPRFGFSGIVENKSMTDISKSMHNHAVEGQAKVHCGLPTCLAFSSKFIAVGTQLGYILLYDLFEVLRQRLGTSKLDDPAARKAGAITSIDLSYNGEVIVAGYSSGLILLWDTIKGVVLRSVSDTHPSPITSLRVLSDLKLVTVDAGGLVNKLTFTKNILWSNYSMETDCLLDGTAGQILAMNVLPPFSTVNPLVRPDALAPILSKLTLIALSSDRSSFAVAVDPKVHVLHRWARPPPEKMDALDMFADLPMYQTYLPCLTWGWALVSGGRNVVMPILARAWGCCVQLLCASFPTLDDGAHDNDPQMIHWPAFGLHEEIDTKTPTVALEWLNDRSLVYLTVNNEFTLVDTVMMTLLERLDFSGLRLVYAEFSLSRSSTSDAPESPAASATTFQNSIRCSDDRLMVLCQSEVKCVSVVSARRRISALEEDGEWLEALALALDHYESTVVSQEDKKRDQTGRRDLSRHPEFSSAKSEDEEWIAKLLTRYINLAVENAPESYDGEFGALSQARIDLAQSHFQMLAGVCVEFCVVTRRLDLLFGPIFRKFQSVGYTAVFLDVLEPYILNDKLSFIAPEVMSFFVDHCKATNGIATVERCLLHMDCTIMDFDTILSLLRANEMYSALFYVFNQGLDDYVTPLEILLERVFDEADAGSATKRRRKDGNLQTAFERYGYKAIIYLKACFSGKTFPQESLLEPEDRRHSVKRELLSFLTRDSFKLSSQLKRPSHRFSAIGQRALLYPYIRLLLLVDAKAMLDTVSLVLDSPEMAEARNGSEGHVPDKQEIMIVLASIVLPTPGGLESLALQSPGLVNAFLDFTAKYLMESAVQVDKEIIFMIMRRMADRYVASKDADQRLDAQRRIMELLSALPRDSYEPDQVLDLISRSGIHRAALLLHQQVASSWHEDSSKDIELRSRHFQSAIDCYLGDDDESFRSEVFDYVKKECSGVTNHSEDKPGDQPKTLRDALYPKLPALVGLDALKTACLVAELFVDELDLVVQALQSGSDGGKSLFLFLQAIISGDLVQVDPVAGSVLNLTMEHHHIYLSLMAKLHPDQVYDYLSTHDNYRPEECLKLCQDYDIADASAYLLERLGNVTSALQLILQTLESRMMNLKRTIRSMGTEVFRQHSSRHLLQPNRKLGIEFTSSQAKDLERVKRILVVALDLCERNSGTASSRSEHGSQLWFNVLDRLINAKGFLRLSKEQPEHAKVMARVLSDLLRLTMQRMVSSVPLTDLVRKVTSDHSGSRLGELREMVESLLGTYGFELKVFEGAITILHQDVFGMQKEHQRLQLKAAPVKSVMNIGLESENASSASGLLRRSSYSNVALQVSGSGHGTLVDSESLPYSRSVEGGLVSALGRLRDRRCETESKSRSGLNLMTETERQFMEGESDPVVYGPRPVSALGQAQHRGRLVTFQ